MSLMKQQINSKGGSCGPAGSNTLSVCHSTAGSVGFPHFLSKVNWQQWEVLPAINMSEQGETNPSVGWGSAGAPEALQTLYFQALFNVILLFIFFSLGAW